MPPTEAYQTDHDPPTLTFCTGETTLALPYHLLRSLHLRETGIFLDYSGYEITVRGTALGKLWKELRAYRVKEIAVTRAAAEKLGGGSACCRVGEIAVEKNEEEGTGE